jgi:hypothetical protein
MRKRGYRAGGPLMVLLSLALATPGLAQGPGANVPRDEIVEVEPSDGTLDDRTFGVVSQVAHTVRIEDFLPPSDTTTYSTINTSGIYVFQTSAPQVDWWGKVLLPDGAIIDRVELQACDTTGTGEILFGLARMDAPASTGSNVTPVGSTGLAATPGCAFFSVVPFSTVQIDNRNKSYLLFVDWSGNFSSANKVAAFRVFYRLQVSPAPGVATFSDVPLSHPFFPFIEALAAAGITGGCAVSPARYCPDDPLTRGQMAVFLGRALGLHFAP